MDKDNDLIRKLITIDEQTLKMLRDLSVNNGLNNDSAQIRMLIRDAWAKAQVDLSAAAQSQVVS